MRLLSRIRIQCQVTRISTHCTTIYGSAIIVDMPPPIKLQPTIDEGRSRMIQHNISSKWRPKSTRLYMMPISRLNVLSWPGKCNGPQSQAHRYRHVMPEAGMDYRTMEDKDNEVKCLNQALIGLKSAYDKDPFPVAGMDESTLGFLIGDLSRRVGNHQDALHYLGRVITDRTAKGALKEKARDQRQLIIKAQRASESEASKAQETPDSTSEPPPPKGLKRLFRKNK